MGTDTVQFQLAYRDVLGFDTCLPSEFYYATLLSDVYMSLCGVARAKPMVTLTDLLVMLQYIQY